MAYTLEDVATMTDLPEKGDQLSKDGYTLEEVMGGTPEEKETQSGMSAFLKSSLGIYNPLGVVPSVNDLAKYGADRLGIQYKDYPKPVRSFMSGINSYSSGVARAPQFAVSAMAREGINKLDPLRINRVVTKAMTGWDIEKSELPEFLKDNPLADYFKEASEAWTLRNDVYKDETLWTMASKGDHIATGEYVVNSIIESSPYTITAILGAMIGIPVAFTSAGLGTIAGAQTFDEAIDKGLNDFDAVRVGMIDGTLEAVFENVGTGRMFNWAKRIVKDFGPKASKSIFKRSLKAVFGSAFGEMNAEFWTQLTQDFNAKVNGLEDVPWGDFIPRAMEAGIVGFGTGVSITGPSAIGAGIQERRRQKIVERIKTDLSTYKTRGQKTGTVIAVAPFAGVSFENAQDIKAQFDLSEYKRFKEQSNEYAKKYGVTAENEESSIGGWRDPDTGKIVYEPSLIINTNVTPENSLAFASELGKARGQKAVYITVYNTGQGTEYLIYFKDNETAFKSAKKLEGFGINGFTLTRSQLRIGDFDSSLKENVEAFYNAEGQQGNITGIEEQQADIREVTADEYDTHIQAFQRDRQERKPDRGVSDVAPTRAEAGSEESATPLPRRRSGDREKPTAIPIKGSPKTQPIPSRTIQEVAIQYFNDKGLPYRRPDQYMQVNIERAKRIARAYDEMKHDPDNLEVKEAYEALIEETLEQYQYIKKMGLKIERIPEGMDDPYANFSKAMYEDVRNGHLWFFPTDQGFGKKRKLIYYAVDPDFNDFNPESARSGTLWFSNSYKQEGSKDNERIITRAIDESQLNLATEKIAGKFFYDPEQLIAQGYDGVKYINGDITNYQIYFPEKLEQLMDQNHPLLRATNEEIDGKPLLANDIFRIVHDIFGHAKEGNMYGPNGEENAWQNHIRMYSEKAGRAMTAETRGQNSWVNYGPYGVQNRQNPKNTKFADQKAGLIPEWVSKEGIAPDQRDIGLIEYKPTSNQLKINKPFIQSFEDKYTPNDKLTEEEKAVEQRVIQKNKTYGAELLNQYQARFGNKINVDDARELFRDVGYDGVNSNAVHEPVSAFMKIYSDAFINAVEKSGNKTALILAGASGSGKTSASRMLGRQDSKYGIVFDATFANHKGAEALIKKLIGRGFTIDMRYIHREASEAWVEGVLRRVTKEPVRVVPLEKHTEQHESAPNTFIRIVKKYKQIEFEVYRNETDKPLVRMTLDELSKVGFDPSVMELEAINATQKLYEENRINERTREALISTVRDEFERRDAKRRNKESEARRRDVKPGAKGREVKQIVHKKTGLKQEDVKRVTEANALREALRKEELGARREFRQGERKARQEYRRGKKEGAESVNSTKQIMERRRRMLKLIAEEYGISDNDMKKVAKRYIHLMSNYEFKLYLDRLDALAVDLQRRRDLKMLINAEIQQKELQKVDNLRAYLKFPSIDKMTFEQLERFNAELESTQKGDEFLSVRKLETVKNTELAGIKTLREAKEKLAERLGVHLKDLNNIEVSFLDGFRYETALARQNIFYQLLVDDTNSAILEAEQKFYEMERDVDELVRKARKSRKRKLIDRLVPTDKLVFGFMEGKVEAYKLTPEELALAHYMQARYAEFRDYLIQQQVMDKYQSDYITHIRRGFLETWKEDGIINAFREIYKQQIEDEAVFKILDNDTQNILPLEKFFQFSMRRSGELTPSQNVASAFKAYTRTILKKQALDKIIPTLDIYAHSLSPTEKTPRGLLMDRSLIKFVREYLNNQKGRKANVLRIAQGSKVDVSLRLFNSFLSIIDLGFNLSVGVGAGVGEQVMAHIGSGFEVMSRGRKRKRTAKGKKILKDIEGLIGKDPFAEMANTADSIGDKFLNSMFILFSASSRSTNATQVLGLMTDAEWKEGKISYQRQAEIKREIGRWRVMARSASIMGATSFGKFWTKYKTWAVAPLSSVIDDLNKTVQMARKKGVKEATKSREYQELVRGATITALLYIAGSLFIGDDEDDGSFISELLFKARRESLSLIGALDPVSWTTFRSVGYIQKLAVTLKDFVTAVGYMATMEERKAREKLEKGYKGLKQSTVPRVITKAFKEDKKGGL